MLFNLRSINHSDLVIIVQNKLVIGFVLMLGPHSFNELSDGFVEIVQFLVILMPIIYQNPRIDTGHTVKYRFCQIHFPLIFPRICDILKLLICINTFLMIDCLLVNTLSIFSYLFLVHGQYVKSLIELYPFACSYLVCVILVYHFGLNKTVIVKWIY